jgi:hypothetical protein
VTTSDSANRLATAGVIDQLDDRHLGVVAVAPVELDDVRVAARPILVALAKLLPNSGWPYSTGWPF